MGILVLCNYKYFLQVHHFFLVLFTSEIKFIHPKTTLINCTIQWFFSYTSFNFVYAFFFLF